MSMKYWQGPEWSAWILEQAAEDTLTKTRQYNADADIWRLLRPEDLGVATIPVGGVLEKQYYTPAAVTLAAGVPTIVISFRVPAGIGITFMGVWCTTNLGMGAVYELHVNTVKRQELPMRQMIPGKGGAFGFDTNGRYGDWAIHAILLEQFVFVRQNDLVTISFVAKHCFTGQIEFWPIAVIAGNRKQLLVAE